MPAWPALLLALHLVDQDVADLARRVRLLAAKEAGAPRTATLRRLEELLGGKPYLPPPVRLTPADAPALLDKLEHDTEDPAGYDQLAAFVNATGSSLGTDNPSVRSRLALAELAQLLRADYDSALPALAQFRDRPVVILFWATWCAPCQAELPQAEKLFREGTAILAVTDEPEPVVREFMRRRGYAFTVALDPDRRAFERFKVDAMPATRVLDRKGRLKIQAGALEEVLPLL